MAVAASAGCAPEGDEPAPSSQEIAGPAPDYVVTEVGNPPGAALNGATFSITTTVANTGNAAAVASSATRYFLSTDQLVGGDASFAESAVVPPLGVGAADSQAVTLSIPAGVASGSYFILACADRRKTVPELSDANNCAASAGAVAVTGPDLVVEVVGEPPAALEVGASFSVTDTTRNVGTAAAPSSVVGYFLSPTAGRGPGARRLSVRRQTGPLAVGDASSGLLTARVPNLASGAYFLVACADLNKTVAEGNEKGNCNASAGTVQIGPPDDSCTGGMAIAQIATSDGFTQIRQAASAQLVITGSGLAGTTAVALGEIAATLVSVSPTEVRADISIEHGTLPGPRTLALTAPAASCSREGAIELTPFVISPTGTADGLGTFQSPFLLCASPAVGTNDGDDIFLLAGEHVGCEVTISGSRLAGQGVATTTVQGGSFYMPNGWCYSSPDGNCDSTVRDLKVVSGGFLVDKIYTPSNFNTELSFENVAVEGAGDGIRIAGYSDGTVTLTVANFTFSGSGNGIDAGTEFLGNYTLVDVSGSRFSNCETGIAIPNGSVDITTSQFDGCAIGILGGSAILNQDDTGFTLFNVTASRFDGCGTGVFLGRGSGGDFADTTFAACDLGIQLGTFPLANSSSVALLLTSCELVDNTVGIAMNDGSATLVDTVIRDDELTLRPSLRGIDARSVIIDIEGGVEITGQALSGFRYRQLGSGLQANVTGLLIEGGEIGMDLVGGEVSSLVVMRDSIIRDQTVASLRYAGDAIAMNLGTAGSPGGNQLSVLSGFAFDHALEGFDNFAVDAAGTTLNGNSYDGQLVEGPIENAPDYRIISFNSIQF